jgi:mannose-6-phosphate isomerase-like protein (cupin superfamily)
VSIQGDNVELLDKSRPRHSNVNSFQSAEIDEAVAGAKAAGGYIGDVVRSELLSVGVYVLAAGGTDAQKPHAEDEVYYAVRGRARFRVGSEDHAVAPGAVLFVAAKQAHHFHEIEEELVLVVFWAPPHDG